MEDKLGGERNLGDIRKANDFLQAMSLLEPPMMGRRFTWTNGQSDPIWVKLDRFLISSEWTMIFLKIIQNCLPRVGSDHVPIRLEMGKIVTNPRPFRFELAWTTTEGFQELISQWWNSTTPVGCGAFIMAKKVSSLREQLRHWAKFSFGSIKLKKLELLQEIDKLDVMKESRCLTPQEVHQEHTLREKLGDTLKQEELYWKQRSRLNWLKEGDENTKFFHATANGRKNRNFINSLQLVGREISQPREIGKLFVDMFHQQFGSGRTSRYKIDLHALLEHKRQVDMAALEVPFTIEEVRLAVFELGGDKAPGPDGFPIHFF
ncbi:uncharacterized protein LOC120274917 [Dioscorea cayenensis subsp. rotundata]|uniref:Uncharacterized protein LOC120274917 n=1 Tax=Dioscorea cayennensis subsp. rotundata TaxID=55577 RepID=A0AB40CFA7_DIOCR|nr:uncharacterized protein LOC120274917 [Dioscorea cayenensis subsp. rotundata]